MTVCPRPSSTHKRKGIDQNLSVNYIYLDSIFSVSFVQFRNHKQHPALERQMSDVSYKLLTQLLVDLFFYLVIRGCKKG